MEPASKKAAPEEDDLLREAQLTSSSYHPLVSFLIPGDRIYPVQICLDRTPRTRLLRCDGPEG